MNRLEARREAYAYQETLVKLLQYSFPVKTTIYCDYGRCELSQGLVGEQQPKIIAGLHVYRALNSAKVYSFKFHCNRVLSIGRDFRAYASRGKKIKTI